LRWRDKDIQDGTKKQERNKKVMCVLFVNLFKTRKKNIINIAIINTNKDENELLNNNNNNNNNNKLYIRIYT